MKKILVMFLVVVGFVFAVNGVLVAGPTPRSVFEDTEGPVVDATYTGNFPDSAVCGYATAISGTTYGVRGMSASSSGYGVRGDGAYGVVGNGSVYGVYGSSTSGYAVYAQGKAGVTSDLDVGRDLTVRRNLTVTGQLNITGAIPTYTNLARSATAMAKTQYHTGGYPATNVIDGIKGQWDNGEWASNGEHGDTWIQLSWAAPQTISKCIFYDRSNKYDNILDAWLLIEQNGDSSPEHRIHLGAFPIGGAEKIVNLTEEQGRNVRAMKLYITESAPTSLNVGLSEWECYYDRSIW